MKLPTSLTTVTPLSKILALLLFITLPIVTFLLGINMGLMLNLSANIITSPIKSSNSSTITSDLSLCSVNNCHGLDVTCGLGGEARACDLIYSLGDNCRQFVKCEEVNGTCQKVISSSYTSCKTCIEKCMSDFKNDLAEQFNCGNTCSN